LPGLHQVETIPVVRTVNRRGLLHLDQILAGQPRRLVFDLARVSFFDCAAARLIAGTEASLPGDHRPVVRRAAPQVRRVFELTGPDIRCEMDGETG
jgi:anti-anti-sigma regulatory factor